MVQNICMMYWRLWQHLQNRKSCCWSSTQYWRHWASPTRWFFVSKPLLQNVVTWYKYQYYKAALGVCDQVILYSKPSLTCPIDEIVFFAFLQTFVTWYKSYAQASIDKIFRHLSQHSQLPLDEEEGTPTAEAEKRWKTILFVCSKAAKRWKTIFFICLTFLYFRSRLLKVLRSYVEESKVGKVGEVSGEDLKQVIFFEQTQECLKIRKVHQQKGKVCHKRAIFPGWRKG